MPQQDKKSIFLPASWKEAIRSHVEENGLKYSFLASKIGTGKTQVSQIMAGVRKLNRFEQEKLIRLIPGIKKIISSEVEPEPVE